MSVYMSFSICHFSFFLILDISNIEHVHVFGSQDKSRQNVFLLPNSYILSIDYIHIKIPVVSKTIILTKYNNYLQPSQEFEDPLVKILPAIRKVSSLYLTLAQAPSAVFVSSIEKIIATLITHGLL